MESAHDGRLTHPCPIAWSTVISIETLCERLELLLELGVPCLLRIAVPRDLINDPRAIKRFERKSGRLVLVGNNFSLHLNEEHIEAVYVMRRWRADKIGKVLELRGKRGYLCARVLCPPGNPGTAAWQDVMDSFILPSFDTISG